MVAFLKIQADYDRAVMLWSCVNLHESVDSETRNHIELMLANVTENSLQRFLQLPSMPEKLLI
ncbi:MAG: hypothetical protein Q9P01_12020 [Anaerolineae bacterium]|nr:hypothetical protein [Anaerolineae bacterium]MDQ7035525.1 hypothetical protein [Anaerolineae bacterium]